MVDIVLDAGGWESLAGIEMRLEEAAAALAQSGRVRLQPSSRACIALSDDESVRRLNASYRSKDKPTNVLSFPAPAMPTGGAGTENALGDVVLAYETVLREAQSLAIPPTHHIQHLAVHGLLHLLGYDHETEAGAAEMEGLETEILAGLGIADPYAEPATAGAPAPGNASRKTGS